MPDDTNLRQHAGYIGKVLCALTFHLALWVYREDGLCTQDGVCKRCEAKVNRVEHEFYRHTYDYETMRVKVTDNNTCGRCEKSQRKRRGLITMFPPVEW